MEKVKLPIPKVKIRVDKMLRDFIIFGGTDILLESDFSSYEKSINKESFYAVDGVAAFSNSSWTYYFSEHCDSLKREVCGKWMYFYNDVDFAKNMCLKSIKEGACLEAKHGNSKEGVCCFYINGDDQNAHKKVIRFLLDNGLVKKTSDDRYYNVSFKYDSQTQAGEYGTGFTADIRLEDFIDLQSGEWKRGCALINEQRLQEHQHLSDMDPDDRYLGSEQ
jgi:type I restriction enzyme R subunit